MATKHLTHPKMKLIRLMSVQKELRTSSRTELLIVRRHSDATVSLSWFCKDLVLDKIARVLGPCH